MDKSTKNKLKHYPYRYLTLTLILVGLFFLPFNSYEGVPFLGEFAQESCFLFFALALLFEGFKIILTQKISIPWKHPIFILLLAVLFWFLLSYFFNFLDIQDYYIKKTTGNNRFIRQYGALIISALILYLTYYNVFKSFSIDRLFIIIRKVFLYSFIVVSIYTLIEISIVYLKLSFLEPFIKLFDYFPFTEVWLDYKNQRLSSVSYAPPVFGIYLMTIAGWMFSYIITHKSLFKFLPSILIVLFAILSDSRSVLVMVGFQLLIFSLYFIKKRKYHKNLIKVGFLVTVISIPILLLKGPAIGEFITDKVTSFDLEESKHSVSNKSRLGMIYTSGLIFLENPIKGVGFGMQAYAARPLYPKWATEDNWEFEQKYLNDNYKTFPPNYNVYTRLLAETGIIGFFLFAIFVFILIYVSYKKIGSKDKSSIYYIVLLVSFVGYAINWLQVDTFRVFGFWICLALFTILTQNKIIFGKKHIKSCVD
ncbi:O-antigen ligase [Psychroflexus salarius]|uniref:O-antigen ligase n=1 Tax=Psychroflexus salarius TaxID=1155689 RepID=A0A1M4UU25_9FLAO|nr:O-antigen polymerase [Psychroflexus salarius]SHE60179.1 O-antigen ligase [Psychroflexus salarius]